VGKALWSTTSVCASVPDSSSVRLLSGDPGFRPLITYILSLKTKLANPSLTTLANAGRFLRFYFGFYHPYGPCGCGFAGMNKATL
jgi:hypothetical protein